MKDQWEFRTKLTRRDNKESLENWIKKNQKYYDEVIFIGHHPKDGWVAYLDRESVDVTHIVRLDYGETEFKIFHKANPNRQPDEILQEAIEAAAKLGWTLPPMAYTYEVYPAPEYDED